MELHELFGAVMILKESMELLPRNGKLMALLIILYFAFSFIFSSIFTFTVKPLLRDFLVKEAFFRMSSSNSSEYFTLLAGIKEDLRLFLLVHVVFYLGHFVISFFSAITTIFLSALSYTKKNSSIKNLLLMVLKSWKKPLVTGLYTVLLLKGYFFVVFFMASPLLISPGGSTLSLAILILLVVLAYIFYLYLAVVWVLSLVVSVIEDDCFGIEALGKAQGLVRGKRLDGFVINVLFHLTVLIIFLVFRIIRGHKWLVNPTAIAFFTWSFFSLLYIFHVVTFAVFYFHCKSQQGEEIELHGGIDSLEYTKIPGPLLFNYASEAEFVSEDKGRTTPV